MRLLALVPLVLLVAACSAAEAQTSAPDIERCLTADGRSLAIESDILAGWRASNAEGNLTLHLEVHAVSYHHVSGNTYAHWGEYHDGTFSDGEFLAPYADYIVGTINAATCDANVPGISPKP